METPEPEINSKSTSSGNSESAPPPFEQTTGPRRPLASSSWINSFTRFHRIPVFKRVWLYLFLMACYTIVVDVVADATFPASIVKEAGATAYGSIVLGLLLVFRTNTAYERWTEGRKLWGQLVNDSRNITLKIRSFIKVPDDEKYHFGELVISFAYALKHHLRNSSPKSPLPGVGQPNAHEAKNLPVYIATKLFDVLARWRTSGAIDTLMLISLENQLKAFMDVCGACERIKNSPLAVSYRAFMRQGIVINLGALPWYITPQYSIVWCLPLILIGTYFLIGLELIAEDVEEPFGRDGDDLPLDSICNTIRGTVADILGMHKQQKFTQSNIALQGDLLKEP